MSFLADDVNDVSKTNKSVFTMNTREITSTTSAFYCEGHEGHECKCIKAKQGKKAIEMKLYQVDVLVPATSLATSSRGLQYFERSVTSNSDDRYYNIQCT